MKRSNSLALPTAGSVANVNRGELRVSKGTKAVGLRLKLVIPFANSAGAGIVPSAADKAATLDSFLFSLKYGRSARMPFQSLLGTKLRALQRWCFGSEVEGWNDATNGLARTIPATGSANATIYLIIPTGKLWMAGAYRNLLGMGPSQASTCEIEVRRQATGALTAGLSISGTVAIEVQPLEVVTKGDTWSYIPEYRETDTQDIRWRSDDGLPLLLVERTAAMAATAFTRINLKFDDYQHHLDAAPLDIRAEQLDVPNYPAEGDVTDTWTVLYQMQNDRDFGDLPTGVALFEQPAKDLATMKIGYYFVPTVSFEDRRKDIYEVAQNIRKKTIKAISRDAVEQLGLPSRFSAFVPAMLADNDDAEFERYPGIASVLGSAEQDTGIAIPASVNARLKAQVQAHQAAGERVAAEAAVKQVAAAVPGASTSGRGFKRGSPVYEQLRNTAGVK